MRFLISLLPLLLLFTSCADDAFATTVNIPFPEHEPLPVLTMDMRSGDTAIYYRIGLSQGVVDTSRAPNAATEFTVSRDGEQVVSLTPATNFPFGISQNEALAAPIPAEVATYEARVKVTGFEEIVARQTMPTVPVISNLRYEPEGAINTNGDRVDELEFDLADDPATEDYYGFRVVARSRMAFRAGVRCDATNPDTIICDTLYEFQTYQFGIDSPDPTFRQSESYGLVVGDGAFTGADFRVRLIFNRQFIDDVVLSVEVYHLTEDAYRYGITKYAYLDAGDNPFAEPVTVHNNVENGYGYFIMANQITVPLEE